MKKMTRVKEYIQKNKRLTILYSLFTISIVLLGSIFAYDYIRGAKTDHNLSKVVKEFKEQTDLTPDTPSGVIGEDSGNQTEAPTKEVIKTDGYKVIGVIKINAIGIEYPILDDSSEKALDISICKIAGGDLNTAGNIALAGHNMRSGRMFAKVKSLKVGQKIEITDSSGKKLEYTIYNKFTTNPDDVSVLTQNTDGRKLITLITCTNDSDHRVIVQAEETTKKGS